MDNETRERIEKELYKHIDIFCGGRENHTPILVGELLKLFEAEHSRITELLKEERNKAIDECIKLLLDSDVNYNGSNIIDGLEALKK